MPLTDAPQTTALLAVANDVPEFNPSFIAPSGAKAWDVAKAQFGATVIEHDVWQREDGTVYGSTRADFGAMSAAVTDGSESVHVHNAESVVVHRKGRTTRLTIRTADGHSVDVYLHGEHVNGLPITEKL